jgi:hypothetical protein
VCLAKALVELEIRLLVVGLLQQLTLALEADQDLTLKVIPSPSPADVACWCAPIPEPAKPPTSPARGPRMGIVPLYRSKLGDAKQGLGGTVANV